MPESFRDFSWQGQLHVRWTSREESDEEEIKRRAVEEYLAQMKKEVVLTGMADRIEIWSKEKWIENNSYEDMDDIAASMQELGLSI